MNAFDHDSKHQFPTADWSDSADLEPFTRNPHGLELEETDHNQEQVWQLRTHQKVFLVLRGQKPAENALGKALALEEELAFTRHAEERFPGVV